MFISIEKYKTPLPKTRKQDWYHGTLDRNEALSMLREVGNRDGAFLIRYSDRNGGMDVLTMIFSGQPYNFQIQRQVRLFDFLYYIHCLKRPMIFLSISLDMYFFYIQNTCI